MEKVRTNACPNPACEDAGKVAAGNIILHGAFTKTTGASQRCLCKTCGTTFSGNTGTAYFGLRCSRDEFEQVMKMRVEGVSIAAIARIAGRARSAITRWVERASASAKNFNDKHLRDFELQLHPAPSGAQVRPSLQDAGDAGGAGSPSTVFP